MILGSRLRLGKLSATEFAPEVAIAVAWGCRNKMLTGRLIREHCGPRMRKLVVFQEPVVVWFETRCRMRGIHETVFVACIFEKPTSS
jgi:hypothetical protein